MGNFLRNDRSDRQMYRTVCDECGQNCEVPFKPRGDKPIFCSQCFEDRGNGRVGERDSRRRSDGNGNNGHDRFSQRDSRPRRDYNDRRHSSGKNYGSDRDHKDVRNNNNEQVVKELKILNEKLNEVLRILAPPIKVRLPKEDVPEESRGDLTVDDSTNS